MEDSRQNETLILNSELTDAQKRSVQRRVESGELFRISTGIATSLKEDQWGSLMQREKLRISSSLFPGAVISHKSAFNGLSGSTIHLVTTSKRREVELPNLKIISYPGSGPVSGDKKIGGRDLYFPSQARMFLDNLTRNDGDRNASRIEIEERLLQICEIQGEQKLLDLRNEIDEVANVIGRSSQGKDLERIIGVILGTRSVNSVSSPILRAAASGYDRDRVDLFDRLVTYFKIKPMPQVRDVASKGESLVNFGFLESYFSNFIEGTEFEIEEARRIVLEGGISLERPKDAHDITGVFSQIVDPGWRFQSLSSSVGAINQIIARHRDMMSARPETRPGEFKLVANKAGNTNFVQPRLVRGTLAEGVKRISDVEPGLARALYSMFLISEVHPFDDGNGRLARLVMNSELSQAGLCRIIVPTLFRENYLDCLRVLTREGDPSPFVKSMIEIQDWSSAFEYENLSQVIDDMSLCNAFQRSLVEYKLSLPVEKLDRFVRDI